MLERLTIDNFVLMKSCEIHFSPSLNIITGETGTGKSVLLSALQLLLGAKAESESIRHGEEKAIIEGSFFVKDPLKLLPHIEEYGIEPEEKLLIRRELSKNGKHKTYLNTTIVPITLIRSLAPHLLSHHDLETCFALRSNTFALEKLDLFASLDPLRHSFQEKWASLLALKESYKRIIEEESFREIELAQLKKDIESLESLQLDSFQDDLLFERYQKASSQKKTMETITRLEEFIDNDSSGLLAKAFLAKQMATSLSSSPIVELLEGALTQIKEASYTLQKMKGDSFLSDEDMLAIEKKLSLFDTLKRKFRANSAKELIETLLVKKGRHEELLTREEKKKEVEEALDLLEQEVQTLSSLLSKKRKESAPKLASEIEKNLRPLNMPAVSFSIHLKEKERSSTGEDSCTFQFIPNPGEHVVDVHKSASNGELARIFLALCTSLSSKEHVSTLLFDEIDSNIGGFTALSVGTLLEEMSKTRQILAITHFPQVAQFAHAHFALKKEVVEERTITSITKLSREERKSEQLRMSGRKK